MKYELEIASLVIPMAEQIAKGLKGIGVENDKMVNLLVSPDGFIRLVIKDEKETERVEIMRSGYEGYYHSDHYINGGYQE